VSPSIPINIGVAPCSEGAPGVFYGEFCISPYIYTQKTRNRVFRTDHDSRNFQLQGVKRRAIGVFALTATAKTFSYKEDDLTAILVGVPMSIRSAHLLSTGPWYTCGSIRQVDLTQFAPFRRMNCWNISGS